MAKLTMTVYDVYYAMRDAGIPSTPARISAGIESGAYPFGTVINVGETGRRTLLIYRVDFDAWLKSKMPADMLQSEQPLSAPLRLVHSM